MGYDLNKIHELYAKNLNNKMFLPRDYSNIKKVEINDLPVMLTRDGKVVCIPKTPEMGLITAVGLTGHGKTMLAGFLIDNIYWNWGDNICILNDSQDETLCWSEPNDVPDFTYTLKKIYQKPMPLPIIYLFPNSENFDSKEAILKDKNSIIISVPFTEVMGNIDKYVPGLGASEKYLLEKKAELLEAQSEEELFNIIDSIDTGNKGMDAVARKIRAAFKKLIDEEILNISDPTRPSYLKIKRDVKTEDDGKIFNPFVAILKAECIPSLITSDLYIAKYKDAIFSYYIRELFHEALKGELKGKRTWLYFDELTWVIHADQRKTSPETENALANVASRGRNNGISLIYATQSYNEIPRAIRSQTKYAIIFKHKDKEQAKGICDDFGIPKTMRDEIIGLKKFEAIIATTEYLVCYRGSEKTIEKGPFKGVVFPPLHKNRFLRKEE